MHSPTVQERFWSKVDRRGPDECWTWKAGASRGYGHIRVNGKGRRASQIAWELENRQPFPPKLYALHTCDNPPCVNPAHIWPGTQKDNIRDAVQKGRLIPDGTTRRKAASSGAPCRKCGHIRIDDYVTPSTGTAYCRQCKKQFKVTEYERLKRLRETRAALARAGGQ